MATGFLLLTAATLLLVVSLCPTPTTCQSMVIPDVVMDLAGNPVEYGAEYSIIPVGSSLGGGFMRASGPDKPGCPQYAVLSPVSTDKGEAVKFEAVGDSLARTEVLTMTNLRINAGLSFACISRGYWKVRGEGPIGGRNEIIVAGFPSISVANFTLVPANTSPLPVYNILHCFNCDDPTKLSVVDMMRVIEDNSGMRILGFPAANDVSRPLQVVFVKKTSEIKAAVFEYLKLN